jgi:hypothetical protein
MTTHNLSRRSGADAETFSINPGPISQPGIEGGPGFILSAAEWVTIQAYVQNGMALPTTGDEFRNSLGDGAPSDLSDFQKLITAYQAISSHCTTWQNSTFPKTVSLAGNIYDYGMNKAPVYYPAILQETAILVKDPADEDAKTALKAILENLRQTANGYASDAQNAAQEVQNFANQTQDDKTVMVGPDGNGGLKKEYNDEYGKASKEVLDLNKEIEAQSIVMKAANEEYDKDVIIASTTPTYAWIIPIGPIAAAIVAGVYGDKAIKALERARAAQDKIDALNAKLQADANLMMYINLAKDGLVSIVLSLGAALPLIQKVQGVWAAMADDLGKIVEIIDRDIEKVPPIIANLGVEEAVKAWFNVALKADNYRINAFVQEQPTAAVVDTPVTSLTAWRLRALTSSRTARAARRFRTA